MTRIVCVSDTHGIHGFPIPDGDILIHAGDLTMEGSLQEVAREASWLGSIKSERGFKSILLTAGNHDWLFERDAATARLLLQEKGVTYLQDEVVQLEGLKFWGSPWTPEFCGWAFNLKRGEELKTVWDRIPADTQVLVTHGPPKGKLDDVRRGDVEEGYGDYAIQSPRYWTEHVGCADLRARISELPELKLHVFGHVHKAGLDYDVAGRRFCNASVVNHQYEYRFAPQVIDL